MDTSKTQKKKNINRKKIGSVFFLASGEGGAVKTDIDPMISDRLASEILDMFRDATCLGFVLIMDYTQSD
jgi:hypothetical protein